MTLAKAKARANETFIVQAPLTIVTYDCQNIFIEQATSLLKLLNSFQQKHFSFVFLPLFANDTNQSYTWSRFPNRNSTQLIHFCSSRLGLLSRHRIFCSLAKRTSLKLKTWHGLLLLWLLSNLARL